MPQQPDSIGRLFLAESRATFASQKELAERAIAQLSDEQVRQPLDHNTNSIAVIMKHMAGNMLSRWSDFLTSDGEKPWRDRDREFIDDFADRAAVMDYWQRGWSCLFNTLDALAPGDLEQTVHIRGEPHSVIKAINRQLSHYGYHVGQIMLIARVLAKEKWNVLTIPRGQSQQFNHKVWMGEPPSEDAQRPQ